MKHILYLTALGVLIPAIASAQGIGQELSLWQQILPALITVAVPLLIALGRKVIPLLPKWLLPILAPLLGAALSYVVDASAGQNVGIVMGAVYGGLGTWLREFIKQLQQAAQPQG
jgi:hypothetical protein